MPIDTLIDGFFAFLFRAFHANPKDTMNYMSKKVTNSLKEIRESLLMSKSELAREANVSPITITRIEKGLPCRMETKRKILLALGFKLSDKDKIFGD
jgi:DNA-binding XRE family transcriptional regulator